MIVSVYDPAKLFHSAVTFTSDQLEEILELASIPTPARRHLKPKQLLRLLTENLLINRTTSQATVKPWTSTSHNAAGYERRDTVDNNYNTPDQSKSKSKSKRRHGSESRRSSAKRRSSSSKPSKHAASGSTIHSRNSIHQHVSSPAPGNKMQYHTNSMVIRHDNGYGRDSLGMNLRTMRGDGYRDVEGRSTTFSNMDSSRSRNVQQFHGYVVSPRAVGRSSCRSYCQTGCDTVHAKPVRGGYEQHGNMQVSSEASFPSKPQPLKEKRHNHHYSSAKSSSFNEREEEIKEEGSKEETRTTNDHLDTSTFGCSLPYYNLWMHILSPLDALPL